MCRAMGFLPTHKLGYGDPQVVIQIGRYTQDTFERIGDQIRKFVNTQHHDMGLPKTVGYQGMARSRGEPKNVLNHWIREFQTKPDELSP